MRASRVMAMIAAGAAVTLTVAPAASAYDREVYSYAAGHMIERSDIPKALGTFDPRPFFDAGPGLPTYLCFVPSGDPDASGTDVKIGKASYQFSAVYSPTKGPASSVSVRVTQYAKATDAIKAFQTLKKESSKCTGSGSTTWVNEDGTQTTSSWMLSTSTVPSVAVVGVSSIGITQDNLSVSSPDGDRNTSDTYTVYTLVNDVIISTSYGSSGTTNLTSAQRKAVNQVAFNAVGRWVG